MAAEIVVRKVRPGDVDCVASALRVADRAESLLLGFAPRDGLGLSVAASKEVWTVDVDGVPAAMFGLGHTASASGAPWLLATDRFLLNGMGVARRARRIVASWSRYGSLENWCDARNTTALRFLAWLGFTVELTRGRSLVRFFLPQAVR